MIFLRDSLKLNEFITYQSLFHIMYRLHLLIYDVLYTLQTDRIMYFLYEVIKVILRVHLIGTLC